jgi:uncharacterized protein
VGRFLFIAVAGLVVYLLLKSYFKKLNQTQSPPDAKAEPDNKNKMIRCEHCGVHAPEAEGIKAAGHFYCSDEHYRLSAKK